MLCHKLSCHIYNALSIINVVRYRTACSVLTTVIIIRDMFFLQRLTIFVSLISSHGRKSIFR